MSRDFTISERTILKRLLSFENQNLGEFFKDYLLYDRAIQLDEEKLIYLYRGKDLTPVYQLLEFVSLLDYLEQNRLVFIHTGNSPIIGNIITKNLQFSSDKKFLVNENGASFELTRFDIPTNLTDVIRKYSNTFFYVGGELKTLIVNNFETDESKQLRESIKQTKYSKYAFYIAFFALVFTIAYSAFFKTDVKLDEEQFDNLINRIENRRIEQNTNKILSNSDNEILDSLNNEHIIDSTVETKHKCLTKAIPNKGFSGELNESKCK